jgi:hypothetical protein
MNTINATDDKLKRIRFGARNVKNITGRYPRVGSNNNSVCGLFPSHFI